MIPRNHFIPKPHLFPFFTLQLLIEKHYFSKKTIMRNWIDAWLLMRIPFSIFLMPVFWFTLSDAHFVGTNHFFQIVVLFIIIHILVYPASNGYNSYCDKDETPVGGLASPPKVNRELIYLVTLFDVLAVTISAYYNTVFACMMLIYILVSKAYSWDKIRLKKYPLISTLVVSFFQGFWVYLSIFAFFDVNIFALPVQTYINASVASMFLLGSYPLTQIYQHKSDKIRGDKTLSLLLGIRGTLLFSGIGFSLATLVFVINKYVELQNYQIINYFIFTLPIGLFLSWWSIKVFRNPENADFKHTMRMNAVSSLSMSALFIANSILK